MDIKVLLLRLQNISRKVKGVPQSKAAANPPHKEEEKKDID